jgi:hypothetical protein
MTHEEAPRRAHQIDDAKPHIARQPERPYVVGKTLSKRRQR